jgi:hypothetical protein
MTGILVCSICFFGSVLHANVHCWEERICREILKFSGTSVSKSCGSDNNAVLLFAARNLLSGHIQ